MATIFGFTRRREAAKTGSAALADFLQGFSIEVMPRTAAKVPDFREILPAGTRVYIAHIDGTPIEEMVKTAARLRAEGFQAMPHMPARVIATRATLEDWVRRYAEVGVEQALLIAGGVSEVRGELTSSMQMMETGLFDRFGFRRLHVAGHPEGNRDIDADGSDRAVMEALRWKNAFAERTDATMAIATQFCFEAAPVIAWADRLAAEGIRLPIHIGVAGPAKLQTLIKFAMSCGVGPSLRVLTRRAADVTKLLLPFTPVEFLTELAEHKAANPGFGIEAVHFFPLGGIAATTDFTAGFGRTAERAKARA
jgi:methylenetetrahydrofolate reductase (NADPH)